MTDEEWLKVKRLLLQWPRRRGVPLDDAAYLRLLRRYTPAQVVDAVEGMIGRREHTPLASEIAVAAERNLVVGGGVWPEERALRGAWAAQHFAGVPVALVSHGASVCVGAEIAPTADAIRPVIARWLPEVAS
jgi:hypothetical protein